MSEELLPELYPKPSKERKRKLPTKKEWHEQAKKMLHLKDLTSNELMELQRFLDDSNNPFKTEKERQDALTVKRLRDEVLRRHGLDPKDWVFLTTTQPMDMRGSNMNAPLTETDMESWNRMLPSGIEMFVNQGAILSTSELDRQRGRDPFITLPQTWEIYIREKPIQLKPSSPQIEEPKEQ